MFANILCTCSLSDDESFINFIHNDNNIMLDHGLEEVNLHFSHIFLIALS